MQNILGILCNIMWNWFVGQEESSHNIEEYTISKFGDILGNYWLKTLFVAEVSTAL